MKNFLTPLEQNELKTRHRAEKNRRDADRIKAILLSDQGWTYRDIAQALLLDDETIMRYVHAFMLKERRLPLNQEGLKAN